MSRLQGAYMGVNQFGTNARRLCPSWRQEKHNHKRSRCSGQNAERWNKKPFSRAHSIDAFCARGLRELLTKPLTELGRRVLVQVAVMEKCAQRLDLFQFGLAFEAALQMTFKFRRPYCV